MAKKEKLTTMKQESIKKGLTKPMSSKRPKSWKGGSVAKQTKNSKEHPVAQRNQALNRDAKKITGRDASYDRRTQRLASDLLKTRKGK